MRRLVSLAAAVICAVAAWAWFDVTVGRHRLWDAYAGGRRARRRSQLAVHPVQAGDTVFLGDSLTEEGSWAAAFPGLAVCNRGVGGDTTADVLERLDDAVTGPPAAVILCIGTNDLWYSVAHAQIVRNTARILDHVMESTPSTRLVLQAVPPRRDRYQAVIPALNTALRRVADERGIEFVDLTEALSGRDGLLDATLTNDGLHLNGDGYRHWYRVLEPVLEPVLHPTH
jgi:lysophospholipase L1-like esterase